jgi:hypothetical protein
MQQVLMFMSIIMITLRRFMRQILFHRWAAKPSLAQRRPPAGEAQLTK